MRQEICYGAPSAPIAHLLKRAALMKEIRQFFHERGLLEVETPILTCMNTPGVHLQSFKTVFSAMGGEKIPFYLTTSPEYYMKRLLAAGSGPIFQLSRCFRNGEQGRFHHPEFTLLEWYRPDYTMYQLMNEVDDFLQQLLSCSAAELCSYQQLFLRYLEIDPLTITLQQLRKAVTAFNLPDNLSVACSEKSTLLQYLLHHAIEPHIGQRCPVFIYHFPADQAAVAQISYEDKRVAERFEVYYRGIALANGFHEVSYLEEQFLRFARDNRQTSTAELVPQTNNRYLIAISQEGGFPDYSSVALGVDRLLMLLLTAHHIREVVSFDTTTA